MSSRETASMKKEAHDRASMAPDVALRLARNARMVKKLARRRRDPCP